MDNTTIRNCFKLAGYWGGIRLEEGSLNISNSSIYNNSGTHSGSAISGFRSGINIVNCDIRDHSEPSYTIGLDQGSLKIENSNIYDNAGGAILLIPGYLLVRG